MGATALCALTLLGFLPESGPAQEASLFNSGGGFAPAAAAAVTGKAPEKVVPLGTAFGIKLFTNGVIVASLSDIYTENGTCCPAAEAGIKPGDSLLEADGQVIENNAALARIIGGSGGTAVTFKVQRDEKIFEASVTPVYGQGSFKTGMWVRDSAAGIGTLTFWDPESGVFGGLGHGICDMDAGAVMPLKSGEPSPITLCGVIKGEPNHPGQLRGYFSSDQPMGNLLINNETGVYGVLDRAPEGQAVEVLSREQVRRGKVKIMATLDQDAPKLYDAEIVRISAKNQRTKNLVVQVTDPRLLDAVGGIVQGMSGCPILQDGKLAGAVTHVFTEDPSMGFGIFAQTMCEESTASGMSK